MTANTTLANGGPQSSHNDSSHTPFQAPPNSSELALIPSASSHSTPAPASTSIPAQNASQSPQAEAIELIFLGTGTSGCVPVVQCLTAEPPTCPTCTSPLKENKRLNTSAIVRIRCPPSSTTSSKPVIKNLLIDAGKTLYPSTLAHFPRHKINSIDALLLTHAHADAMFGLDDLRSWTLPHPSRLSNQTHIDVYCSSTTMAEVTRTFPYLVDKSQATGGGDVPSFVWHVFDEWSSTPFTIPSCGDVQITPLPVEHGRYLSSGKPFWNLGFRVGGFSYISDCSGIPEVTRERMAGSRVVVLDGLRWEEHASHWSLRRSRGWVRDVLGNGVVRSKRPNGIARLGQEEQAGEGETNGDDEDQWTPELGPQSTWLTGFSHQVEHVHTTNEFTEWGEREGGGMYVRPAWDGLRLGVDGRPLPGS